jgi:hypothetical protein
MRQADGFEGHLHSFLRRDREEAVAPHVLETIANAVPSAVPITVVGPLVLIRSIAQHSTANRLRLSGVVSSRRAVSGSGAALRQELLEHLHRDDRLWNLNAHGRVGFIGHEDIGFVRTLRDDRGLDKPLVDCVKQLDRSNARVMLELFDRLLRDSDRGGRERTRQKGRQTRRNETTKFHVHGLAPERGTDYRQARSNDQSREMTLAHCNR